MPTSIPRLPEVFVAPGTRIPGPEITAGVGKSATFPAGAIFRPAAGEVKPRTLR
jgi:hypothetical protein